MYVNPFLFGVFCTVVFELILFIVIAIIAAKPWR